MWNSHGAICDIKELPFCLYHPQRKWRLNNLNINTLCVNALLRYAFRERKSRVLSLCMPSYMLYEVIKSKAVASVLDGWVNFAYIHTWYIYIYIVRRLKMQSNNDKAFIAAWIKCKIEYTTWYTNTTLEVGIIHVMGMGMQLKLKHKVNKYYMHTYNLQTCIHTTYNHACIHNTIMHALIHNIT